jgi:hypothetical protein
MKRNLEKNKEKGLPQSLLLHPLAGTTGKKKLKTI